MPAPSGPEQWPAPCRAGPAAASKQVGLGQQADAVRTTGHWPWAGGPGKCGRGRRVADRNRPRQDGETDQQRSGRMVGHDRAAHEIRGCQHGPTIDTGIEPARFLFPRARALDDHQSVLAGAIAQGHMVGRADPSHEAEEDEGGATAAHRGTSNRSGDGCQLPWRPEAMHASRRGRRQPKGSRNVSGIASRTMPGSGCGTGIRPPPAGPVWLMSGIAPPQSIPDRNRTCI